MLNNSKFICNPEAVIEKERPWGGNTRFNNRSVTLSNYGGLACFKKEFTVDKLPKTAKITATALGIFELYLNGKRIGNDELKPGCTRYDKTVYAFTYDIAGMLTEGENTLIAEVSGGWYNGRISFGKYDWKPCAFRAEMTIGRKKYATDESWLTAVTGPYQNASIYDGVLYDANKNYDAEWTAATVTDEPTCEIFEAPAPSIGVKLVRPVLNTKIYDGVLDNASDFGEINVISTKSDKGCEKCELKKGNILLCDFEQNLVGRPHFIIKAPKGTKIVFMTAEMLNDSGKRKRGNDYAKGSAYIENYRSAASRIEFISDGKKADFTPLHTFYGFRYLEISADKDIKIELIEAQVISSLNTETGSFECSDESVNKLFSNIVWGARGNYLSIPTDCPQRDERLGWTGDTQIFVGAGSYLLDVEDFMKKWLRDMRDSQYKGGYPDVAPCVFSSPDNYYNAAWTDAGIIVPYEMYFKYGNAENLAEHYESMEAFFEGFKTRFPKGHRNNYGDWLSYEKTEKKLINYAYMCYDLSLMIKMSEALGKTDRAEYYKAEYDKAVKRFRRHFVDKNGLKETSQTSYILALAFDLLSDRHAKAAREALRKKLVDNDYTHSTGFVGCGYLNQTLSKEGMDDLAYDLLLNRKDPSWLYSVDQGATTVWERWNSYTKKSGFGNVGMNSFNHYAYGCVAEWMFKYMCGIKGDFAKPGFAELYYDPRPDTRDFIPSKQKRITYAQAEYFARSGRIFSRWDKEKNGFKYTLSAPEDVKIHACIPAVSGKLTINGEELSASLENGKWVFDLDGGEYEIKA